VAFIEPSAFIFSVHDGAEATFGTYRGEIRVDIDSEETAFITPCNRIQMDEHIQELLVAKLEPIGVRYMRWWVNGRLIGRTFGEPTL
jgi:hypothetical protein